MSRTTAGAKKTATSKKQGGGKKKIVIAAVIVAIAGCTFLAVNAGNLAKLAVEKIAADTLGVQVGIAALDVSLQDKTVTVRGVTVANPSGYTGPYAAQIATIAVAAQDIGRELIVIDDIAVTGATFNLETGPGGTNLGAIRTHALARQQEAEAAKNEGAKIVIRRLKLEKAVLTPPVDTNLSPVTLPDIRIRGIGETGDGAPAAVAIAQATDYAVQVALRYALMQNMLSGLSPEAQRALQQELGLPSGDTEQVKGFGERIREMFTP